MSRIMKITEEIEHLEEAKAALEVAIDSFSTINWTYIQEPHNGVTDDMQILLCTIEARLNKIEERLESI